MHPLPDQPLPDGWAYIEHPEAGRADNPVTRESLPVWLRAGWTEAEEPEPAQPAQSADAEATASPRRSRTAAADSVKE